MEDDFSNDDKSSKLQDEIFIPDDKTIRLMSFLFLFYGIGNLLPNNAILNDLDFFIVKFKVTLFSLIMCFSQEITIQNLYTIYF